MTTPDVRLLLSVILDEAGYEIETAADANEALVMLEDTKPDLVLLDLVMPGMDGWTPLEAIRVVADTHDVPIVVMSAKFGLINIREHGVQGYVAKPIVPLALVGTLDEVLRAGIGATDR